MALSHKKKPKLDIFNEVVELGYVFVEQSKQSPFIKGIYEGSLDNKFFVSFLEQDLYFLQKYQEIFQLIGQKSSSPDVREQIRGFVREANLECKFVAQNLEKLPRENMKPNPVTLAYTEHLHNRAVEGFVDGCIAMYPCFWLYDQVGHWLGSVKSQNNPYQAWIDFYASRTFQKSVENMTNLVYEELNFDLEPSKVLSLKRTFMKSLTYELAFWQACLTKRQTH